MDDGSGVSLTVVLQGAVADGLRCNYEQGRCDVEVGTLFKAKGELESDWRGEIRLIAHRIDVLNDPLAETKAWQERIDTRRKILDVPWKLKRHDMTQ